MDIQLSHLEYKKALDHLNSAILLFDQHLILKYINSAGEVLLADSIKHLIGNSANKLFKAFNEPLFNNLKQFLALQDPLVDCELQLHQLNQTLTVNFSATPVIDNAILTGIVVELLPVDRHIKISKEEQLIAQQNNTRLLVRGLAHEIKNPLGGLRGAAQLLEQELTEPDLKEYTQIIIAESDRLQDLMDKMLGPNKPTNKQIINIHEALERVRHLVNVESSDKVEIHTNYDPSIPDLYADKNLLIQAFLNITRNAVQAFKGEGTIWMKTRIIRHITLGRKIHKLAIKIQFIDDGPGIRPELLPTIFYPMITGRAEGTGLGLSISQSLINQHNGLIECNSEPGKTIFSVFLPLEESYAHS